MWEVQIMHDSMEGGVRVKQEARTEKQLSVLMQRAQGRCTWMYKCRNRQDAKSDCAIAARPISVVRVNCALTPFVR